MAMPTGGTTHPSLPSSGLLCVFYDLVYLSPRKVRDPLKEARSALRMVLRASRLDSRTRHDPHGQPHLHGLADDSERRGLPESLVLILSPLQYPVTKGEGAG